MSEINPEIQAAMEMAEAYAKFAPGRLFLKQMNADGDEIYETTILPAEAKLRFLFPQLFVLEKNNPLATGMRTLIAAAEAAKTATPRTGTIALRNRPEDLRTIHKARWENYLAKLEPTLKAALTPFQLNLIAQCYGYRPQ
jgi:hypothetical protein